MLGLLEDMLVRIVLRQAEEFCAVVIPWRAAAKQGKIVFIKSERRQHIVTISGARRDFPIPVRLIRDYFTPDG